jgi:hypothetical protein
MAAHGGLIATARAYVQFLNGYYINGRPYTAGGQDWTFLGSLPGTFTLGRQRADGVQLAAFFNQRTDPSGLAYDTILGLLDAAADSIAQWPASDLLDASTPVSAHRTAVQSKNGNNRRNSPVSGRRPYSQISNASAVLTRAPRSAP